MNPSETQHAAPGESNLPDLGGHFGAYGGKFVPETLMSPLEELEHAYQEAQKDPAFETEFEVLMQHYVGRPTPLFQARRLSAHVGAHIYLKREDLCHTGAHKINNGRVCSPSGWARAGSSPRLEPGNMASPLPPCAPCWDSSVKSIWGLRI
jgi:hypothetical protein